MRHVSRNFTQRLALGRGGVPQPQRRHELERGLTVALEAQVTAQIILLQPRLVVLGERQRLTLTRGAVLTPRASAVTALAAVLAAVLSAPGVALQLDTHARVRVGVEYEPVLESRGAGVGVGVGVR